MVHHIRFPDGRTIALDDSVPISLSNRFLVGEADKGMTLNLFYDHGMQIDTVARVGIPIVNVAQFVKAVVSTAERLGVDWESVELERLPEPPSPH